MNVSKKVGLTCLAFTTALGVAGGTALAKLSREAVPVFPLTETGETLQAQYAAQLETLRDAITKALPAIDPQAQETFVSAYRTEAAAMAAELLALRANNGKGKDKAAAAKASEDAKAVLADATARAKAPSSAMLEQLSTLLASDKLDAQLVEFVVLAQATPRGLAAFAQQGPEHKALVDTLLTDADLMKQMVIAGGAKDGHYGEAMRIYTDIRKTSPKASGGLMQRLALATSLEHAVPVSQANPEALTDAPVTVNPVQRYQHFEKAYLAGELDPGFAELTVWDLRMVVNGDEPDATLAWGREMLRNYRPDHIHTADTRWRYVKAVKTDVRYGSQYNKFDKPELQKYQNMIMNGGICGRRAFFGRFILRAFGIPTLPRPQRGHATLAHWSPEGWVINLGAGWGWGWMSFGEDRDFVVHTQARAVAKPFVESLRAQWIAKVLDEPDVFGFHDEPSGFWNGVALYRQRAIVEEAEAVALAAVGTDIGEANESKEKDVAEAVEITDADRTIVIGKDGAITIPAVACTSPTASTEKIVFMKSYLGGLQLHYNRNGAPETFAYEVDVPEAGKYALGARVVTVTGDQHLLVAVNGAAEPVDMVLPLTVGMWERAEPVDITLEKGKNVLTFSRGGENIRGLTIKDFTLTRM